MNGVAQPVPRLDLTEFADNPVIPSDSFDEPDAAVGGFCDRAVVIQYQFAGQPIEHLGQIALELSPELSQSDRLALFNLLGDDPRVMLYASAVHIHLGLPVLTVSAQVGIVLDDAKVCLKIRDSRGATAFALESALESALLVQRIASAQMRRVAQQALNKLLIQFKDKE